MAILCDNVYLHGKPHITLQILSPTHFNRQRIQKEKSKRMEQNVKFRSPYLGPVYCLSPCDRNGITVDSLFDHRSWGCSDYDTTTWTPPLASNVNVFTSKRADDAVDVWIHYCVQCYWILDLLRFLAAPSEARKTPLIGSGKFLPVLFSLSNLGNCSSATPTNRQLLLPHCRR